MRESFMHVSEKNRGVDCEDKNGRCGEVSWNIEGNGIPGCQRQAGGERADKAEDTPVH